MTKRKSKIITDEKELKELFSYSGEELQNTSVFMSLFGKIDGKTKYQTYDVINVPPNTIMKNKNTFTTTIGSYVFNKAILEDSGIIKEIGYINKPVNKKIVKNIIDKCSYAMLEDRITLDQFKKFIDICQKFMTYCPIISPITSEEMLTISNTIEPKKKELLKKYSKEIENRDAYSFGSLEKELLDYSVEKLKDDPALDVINSGAGADLGNNFKNMYLVKGAQKDPDPTKGYNIITSCYEEGISKEDYTKIANSLAAGPYARARDTAKGGYSEKLFLSAFQHIQCDVKGSDCKTKNTITVTLDSKTLPFYMYSYIVEGNKLVRLDSTNMDKYLNKTVKMRFASLCENEKICNKCIGDLYYLLGVKNVGTATPQLASCVKLISMKAFHDSTDKYVYMDPMEIFNIKK